MKKVLLLFCFAVSVAAQSIGPNQIKPGSFQSGVYNFPASLTVNGAPSGNIVTIAPASTPPASWQFNVTTPTSALASIFSLTTTGSTGPATLSGTTLNIPQYAGGSVTSFAAPSASWPAWLVPTVTNSTTTPSLSVAASSTGSGNVVLATSPTLSSATLSGTTNLPNSGFISATTFQMTLTGLASAYWSLPTGDPFNVSTQTQSTSLTNYSSPKLQVQGSYWDGAASQTDIWTIQDVLGTGANPTSALSITHAGTTGISWVVAPHVMAAGTPSIACGTGAGTSPTVCTVTGNDEAGVVNVTTGSAPASTAIIFTITLANSCKTAVYPVTQSSNVNAASLSGNTHTYAASSSATQWTMTSNATGLAASTAYAWTYITRCN